MSGPRLRVLATAFAAVPGSSPHGAAMLAMIDALRADLDLVTVKTEDLSHIKRIGDARMFRVPVGAGPDDERRGAFARAVARQIEADPYDIVHALDPWSGEIAAERKEERGYRMLYEPTVLPEDDETEAWLRAHRASIAAADRVIVHTNAAARALEASGHRGRVEVVRPGVDVGAFDHVPLAPFGTPRVLYVGSFSEVRDLETVLDAVERVAPHRPMRLLLAGELRVARQDELRVRVEARGLSRLVEVRGEPTPRHLPWLIAAADVCIAPGADRRVEGLALLPQPLLEYAACLKPVVAASLPGVSEVVRDEIEGLLYPPGGGAALADALLEVLRDAVLRERIADAGYRRVRDELNAGARRRRIRRLYEDLAPGSQEYDPWADNFEESSGLPEVASNALDALQEGDGVDDDAPDTSETRIPVELARTTTARNLAMTDRPATLDTQPGLVVPDTDPGRR